jgi:ABC-type transport system involved in multi-copper enzyme maturation permease subunit
MRGQMFTIARFTLLEAMRTRLPWLVLAAIVIALLASLFAREIAITETTRVQTALFAASLRLASVFIVGLYVMTSMIREFNDKGLELVLSLDLPRWVYALGKFIGYALIGTLIATAICLPLSFLANWQDVLLWGVSLALELGIIVALSLFCVITFNQIMPAASFVFAFYALSRSMNAIQLISSSSPVAGTGEYHHVIQFMVDGVALLLPTLNSFSQTAWLVNETSGWFWLGNVLSQSAVYIGLLLSAALFDLYRRNF